jgi:hypothetical protein
VKRLLLLLPWQLLLLIEIFVCMCREQCRLSM